MRDDSPPSNRPRVLPPDDDSQQLDALDDALAAGSASSAGLPVAGIPVDTLRTLRELLIADDDALTALESPRQDTDAGVRRQADALMARLALSDTKGSAEIAIKKMNGVRMRPLVPRRSRGVAIAAVIVCAAVVFGIQATLRREPVATQQVYRTAAQQTQLVLSQRIRVTLAPRTTLTVVDRNTVSLEGEGYFSVPATSNRPFVVRTGTVSTRVLGTAFNVQYDSSLHHVRVAVVQGKVMLSMPKHQGVALTAGRMGIVSDAGVTIVSGIDSATYAGWTTGRLVFKNTPVPEFLTRVGRWYGYDFRLTDSVLAKRHVTVAFAGQQTAEVLAVLRQVLGVTMVFDGRVVTLRPVAENDQLKRRDDTRKFTLPSGVGR
jgi:transmembrane sensor